jgi:Putative beta-barrel porin 2
MIIAKWRTGGHGSVAITQRRLLESKGSLYNVNHRSRRKSPPAAAACLPAFAAIALIITPKAHAQVTGKAAATVRLESNSNVFDLNSGAPLPVTGGDAHRGDTFLAYGALFDLEYLLGRQQFFASASTNRFDYQRDTELNHEDYKLDTGMRWTLAQLLDGKIDILRARAMVPFYDLAGTTLSLQTEQREAADVGLKLTPEWRIEGATYTSKLEEPTPQAPNLSLSETSGKATVRYLGISRFTGGLYVSYESGSYHGGAAGANPNYHQYAGGFATTYQSPRSTFEGQLGYSRRMSATGTDNTSGVTGGISLKERLTPKTSVAVTLSRAIQDYLFNTGSEIDTSVGVTAEWQATYKLGVTLGYTYTYRDYPGQGNDPVGSERVDIQNSATLGLDYRPRQWLSIKPYANLQWRISDYIGGDFNATIFGLYVTILTPGK